jgi:hypothetical protein
MPQLSSTIIDDGLTSRGGGAARVGTSAVACVSPRRAHDATVGITSRTMPIPRAAKLWAFEEVPKSQLQPVKIQLIARNRRVLTLRMRAGFLTGRTRAPREPYCPRQCCCPGHPGFGQCWDIGLGNRIERSSHRSAGARIASFSPS